MTRRRFLAVAGGGLFGLASTYFVLQRRSNDSDGFVHQERYELGTAPELAIEGTPDRDFEIADDGETVTVSYDDGRVVVHDVEIWATGVAASVAVGPITRRLDSQVDTDSLSIGFGRIDLSRAIADGTELSEFDEAFGPIVTWSATPDGEASGVSFDEVVEATPRTVDVTLDLDGHEYGIVLPVVCEIAVRQRY